jgi:hypothetical protein
MGGLFKSKSKSTSSSQQTSQSSATSSSQQSASNLGLTQNSNTQTSNTGPSQFQAPYLTGAFDAAKGNYEASAGTPFYTGNLYAGMSDQAKADLVKTRDFALSTGMGTAGQLSSIGSDLAGNFGKASSTIDDYLKLANGDATADILAAAKAYSENPNIDGQIDAVNRDVQRMLTEQTLPGIDRAASGSGNINSSRAGVAAGVAERGAADRMADNAATIRSQAYTQGLQMAQAERANKLGALSTAAGAYSGLGGQGISALTAGSNAGYGALSAINDANKTEQADRQGQATADYQSWLGEDGRASDLLSRYFSIIGGNQWGSSGTSTGTQTGVQVGSQNGTSSGTQTGTSTGTSNGTSTTTSSPGLGGAILGGLSLAGGLGWAPLAAKAAKG